MERHGKVVLREPFMMENTDMASFNSRPKKMAGSAIVFCHEGSAELSIDILDCRIRKGSISILFPESRLAVNNVSEDARFTFFYLSKNLFSEAVFNLPMEFFRFVKEHPVMVLDEDNVIFMNKWAELLTLMDTDWYTEIGYSMIKNQMQCFFWYCYKKMSQFFVKGNPKTKRQDELFREFMALVKTHCKTKRNVEFYSDKLCISPRYLSAVCTQTTSNESAKRIIDRMVILEIKILLETTNIPVQKIAETMNFPDQSYLGRFFKRYTGESPQNYRLSKSKSGIATA